MPEFISFYWSCREFGVDNKKIKEILDIANRALELKSEIQRLQFERKNLEIQIEQKDKKIQYLDYQIAEATNVFNTQYSNYEKLSNETDLLRIQLQNLQKLIKDIENQDEYKNLEKKVEELFVKIKDYKSINLPLILIAVFEALEMIQQNMTLFLIIWRPSKMAMLMVKIYNQRRIIYSLPI